MASDQSPLLGESGAGPWTLIYAAVAGVFRVVVPLATVVNAWDRDLLGVIAGAIGTVGLWTSWVLERGKA